MIKTHIYFAHSGPDTWIPVQFKDASLQVRSIDVQQFVQPSLFSFLTLPTCEVIVLRCFLNVFFFFFGIFRLLLFLMFSFFKVLHVCLCCPFTGILEWPFWTKLVVVAIGFTGGLVFMYVQCKVYIHLWKRLKAYNRVIYVQNRPDTCKKLALEKPPLLDPNPENKEMLAHTQSDTNSSQYIETEDYSMEVLHVWHLVRFVPRFSS